MTPTRSVALVADVQIHLSKALESLHRALYVNEADRSLVRLYLKQIEDELPQHARRDGASRMTTLSGSRYRQDLAACVALGVLLEAFKEPTPNEAKLMIEFGYWRDGHLTQAGEAAAADASGFQEGDAS